MDKEPIRKQKAKPNVGRPRKRPRTPPEKTDAELYVLPPDLLDKLGIRLPQDSRSSESAATDVKRSLQNKLLAKKKIACEQTASPSLHLSPPPAKTRDEAAFDDSDASFISDILPEGVESQIEMEALDMTWGSDETEFLDPTPDTTSQRVFDNPKDAHFGAPIGTHNSAVNKSVSSTPKIIRSHKIESPSSRVVKSPKSINIDTSSPKCFAGKTPSPIKVIMPPKFTKIEAPSPKFVGEKTPKPVKVIIPPKFRKIEVPKSNDNETPQLPKRKESLEREVSNSLNKKEACERSTLKSHGAVASMSNEIGTPKIYQIKTMKTYERRSPKIDKQDTPKSDQTTGLIENQRNSKLNIITEYLKTFLQGSKTKSSESNVSSPSKLLSPSVPKVNNVKLDKTGVEKPGGHNEKENKMASPKNCPKNVIDRIDENDNDFNSSRLSNYTENVSILSDDRVELEPPNKNLYNLSSKIPNEQMKSNVKSDNVANHKTDENLSSQKIPTHLNTFAISRTSELPIETSLSSPTIHKGKNSNEKRKDKNLQILSMDDNSSRSQPISIRNLDKGGVCENSAPNQRTICDITELEMTLNNESINITEEKSHDDLMNANCDAISTNTKSSNVLQLLESPIVSKKPDKDSETFSVTSDNDQSDDSSEPLSKFSEREITKSILLDPPVEDQGNILDNTRNSVEHDQINAITIPLKKKRGRKPKHMSQSVISEDQVKSLAETRVSKANDLGEICKLDQKLNRKAKDKNVSKKCVGQRKRDANDKEMVCAVCHKTLKRNKWRNHCSTSHNFLAWAVGESPIDLNDEKTVVSLLQKRVKQKRCLSCEHCGTKKRSAYGFFAHLQVCSKSEVEIEEMKVECTVCGRKMLPQSMKSHLLEFCKAKQKPNSAENQENILEMTTVSLDQSLLDGTRSKRRAAQMAEETFKKIKTSNDDLDFLEKVKICKKNFTRKSVDPLRIIEQDENGLFHCPYNKCNFSAEIKDEIVEHVSKCRRKPINVNAICNLCNLCCKSTKQMVDHMYAEHHSTIVECLQNDDDEYEEDAISSGSDEMPDEEYESGSEHERAAEKKRPSKNAQQTKKQYYQVLHLKNKDTRDFHYRNGVEFAKVNYASNRTLFDNFHRSDYELLAEERYEPYLPEERKSCNIAHALYNGKSLNPNTVANIEWKNYDLFESTLQNGTLTLWCGGPIWSVAWIPGARETQYLAVAADRSMRNRYMMYESYLHKNLIQIWDAGELSNSTKRCSTLATLAYSIAHDHGVVWDMDSCPSGCDDDARMDEIDNNRNIRMGALAIACSNGNCYIYTIFHPSSLPKRGTNAVYRTNPSITLQLGEQSGKQIQATKICWSKMKNHSVVAVGYSNGMVALFDLAMKSSLLTQNLGEKNGHLLLPYFTFQPFTSLVNGLQIMPFANRDRRGANDVLVGVSSPNGYGLWNGNLPVVRKSGKYSSLCISYPWPQIVCMSEEISVAHGSSYIVGGMAVAPREVRAKELKIIEQSHLSGGGVCDANIYHNGVLIASRTGDVYSNPILTPLVSHHNHMKKNQRKSALLSFADMLNIKGEPVARLQYGRPEKSITFEKMDALTKSSDYNFQPETLTYDEACDKYGLMLFDVPYTSHRNLDTSSYTSKAYIPDRMNLHSILTVRANPSDKAYLFHAYGGQAGHVRIACASHLHDKYTKDLMKREAYF